MKIVRPTSDEAGPSNTAVSSSGDDLLLGITANEYLDDSFDISNLFIGKRFFE